MASASFQRAITLRPSPDRLAERTSFSTSHGLDIGRQHSTPYTKSSRLPKRPCSVDVLVSYLVCLDRAPSAHGDVAIISSQTWPGLAVAATWPFEMRRANVASRNNEVPLSAPSTQHGLSTTSFNVSLFFVASGPVP
ncbi:hypothetical protein E4U42_006561 [Claviceps africana]|uniref:Uncharacterized protein n=1 Tax=Claviceps africana TaxID=83212 RepID=A0A8K0J859_9HYPO|nr:hypothetical protein E4U42_006561 [Claviceps africana]